MDPTNLDSQAANNFSVFPNQLNIPNDMSGNKNDGDGQTDNQINIPNASKNSLNFQKLQPSVNFPIFYRDKQKPPSSLQGVKRQRKASVDQRQSNTISKYLVKHN